MCDEGNFLARVKLEENGQIRLPESVRLALEVGKGEMLKFTATKNQILIEAETSVSEEPLDKVFIPEDKDLLLFRKCLDKCTIC